MLVLASQSPRRSELLRQAGLSFVVRIPNVAESRLLGEPPQDYVRRLAIEKARAAAAGPAEFVLAADTVVVADGRGAREAVLGRRRGAHAAPPERPAAYRAHGRVRAPRRRRARRGGGHRVVFSPMTDEEVRAYAAVREPMDKAGAYAIQGRASKFVERIEGCYFNVVGLPVSLVYRLLKQAGYEGPAA